MICAIILAAGRSRRMGTQKLLLPFAGRTVVGHIAGEILRGPISETLVVVGQDAARIAEALAGLRLKIVTNPDPGGEMLSSVRCGLRALPTDCDAVLVALGDQPTITSDLVGRMIDAFRTGARGIVVPVHGGKPGHPILFSARYRQEILTGYDDVGLCGLRQAHPEDVLEFGVASPSVLGDMDYPEDYRRELAKFPPCK
ncbi:MAG: nucleotidyltransferase family protein [Planctomycetes bacterium]|nr:nucleotidyltransferase family protein [Planctomycetota bacterium]